jgi:choloylglycine hydrolase
MWLDGTKYPDQDSRPAVSELGFVQYLLDTCATAAEAMEQAGRIRIAGDVPIHFLVADKSGAAVSIEFLDGKLAAHAGEALPSPVLTNDTYEKSTKYLRGYEGFGGYAPLRGGPGSLDRFCRAAARVKAYSTATKESPVDYAFGILANVAQGEYTRWSIVYDTARLTVYFRTLENAEVRRVSFGSFDLSCATPVRVYDLASAGEGDVGTRFVDYTREANRNLIGRSFGGVDFLKGVPGPALDAHAAYPEALTCK